MVSTHDAQALPESQLPDSSSLALLINDLRGLRNGMISKERRRRPAILIGQLALLVAEYKDGRRPSRRTLRRWFYFVCREKAA
jgi:hypothetical protein